MAANTELLAGLKVVEIAEGICGPLAGKVLRDLGADITRIEPPAGDWMTKLVPDEPAHDAISQALNFGKTTITLDLATPAGQAALHKLVAGADICLVGERMCKHAKLGVDYATLKKIAPLLVYCHISGWGSEGPMGDRAASELAIQTVTGMTRYLGVFGGEPLRQGFDLASCDAGFSAVQAVLAAIIWREASGEGQYVEVSMLAAAIALMQWDIPAESGPDKWEGRQLDSVNYPPDHGFQCADGRCLIDMRSHEEAWPAILREIGCDDLADDPRFNTRAALDLNVTKLPGLTAGKMSTWSYADLEKLVRDTHAGTIVPMLSIPEVVAHPQVAHIGIIKDGRVGFPMEATLVSEKTA